MQVVAAALAKIGAAHAELRQCGLPGGRLGLAKAAERHVLKQRCTAGPRPMPLQEPMDDERLEVAFSTLMRLRFRGNRLEQVARRCGAASDGDGDFRVDARRQTRALRK